MGKLVVTDSKRQSLRAQVSEAPQGSRLSFVVGSLVRDQWDADVELGIAPVEILDSVTLEEGESETVFEIDTTRACFVRAELRNPAGHLIAFGNPISFLPYWPESWPYGRVAFDWQGVRLAAEDGLLLESARVDLEGRLLLEGSVFSETGERRLASGAQPASIALSAGTSRWDDSLLQLVLTEIHPGRFTVSLSFAAPLKPGRTANPIVLPDRMSMLAEVDVGDPSSEAAWQLSGLRKIMQVTGAGSYRVLGSDEATFVLPLPAGQPSYLTFTRAILPPRYRSGFVGATSRRFALDLLVDGVKVGSILGLESKLIEIPARKSPSGASETETRITLRARGTSRPMIDSMKIFSGPGVVQY
jgi:hypothetical protein